MPASTLRLNPSEPRGAESGANLPSRALGEFLRAIRQRRSLQDVGLSGRRTKRRRAPGLRREEVATLAGRSVSWVIALERGRLARPSLEALENLADALKCSPAERAHLRELSTAVRSPVTDLASFRGHEANVPPDLTRSAAWVRRLLGAFAPHPAFAMDRNWDVVGCNRTLGPILEAIAGDPGWAVVARTSASASANVIELLFSTALRPRLRDWRRHARRAVGGLRASVGASLAVDAALQIGEEGNGEHPPRGALSARARRLIDSLTSERHDFSELWAEHHVWHPHRPFVLCFDSPRNGRLAFDCMLLDAQSLPKVTFCTWIPCDDHTRSELGYVASGARA